MPAASDVSASDDRGFLTVCRLSIVMDMTRRRPDFGAVIGTDVTRIHSSSGLGEAALIVEDTVVSVPVDMDNYHTHRPLNTSSVFRRYSEVYATPYLQPDWFGDAIPMHYG